MMWSNNITMSFYIMIRLEGKGVKIHQGRLAAQWCRRSQQLERENGKCPTREHHSRWKSCCDIKIWSVWPSASFPLVRESAVHNICNGKYLITLSRVAKCHFFGTRFWGPFFLSAVPGCSWLYQALPGCTWLCFGLPWSDLVYLSLPWSVSDHHSKVVLSAQMWDWIGLKLGWMDLWTVVCYWALLCGANNVYCVECFRSCYLNRFTNFWYVYFSKY